MSDTTPNLSEAVKKATAARSKRTGACTAVATLCDCPAFALAGREDGFPICVCTHTQWAHAEGKVDA